MPCPVSPERRRARSAPRATGSHRRRSSTSRTGTGSLRARWLRQPSVRSGPRRDRSQTARRVLVAAGSVAAAVAVVFGIANVHHGDSASRARARRKPRAGSRRRPRRRRAPKRRTRRHSATCRTRRRSGPRRPTASRSRRPPRPVNRRRPSRPCPRPTSGPSTAARPGAEPPTAGSARPVRAAPTSFAVATGSPPSRSSSARAPSPARR